MRPHGLDGLINIVLTLVSILQCLGMSWHVTHDKADIPACHIRHYPRPQSHVCIIQSLLLFPSALKPGLGVVISIDYENGRKGDNWYNGKLDNTYNVKGDRTGDPGTAQNGWHAALDLGKFHLKVTMSSVTVMGPDGRLGCDHRLQAKVQSSGTLGLGTRTMRRTSPLVKLGSKLSFTVKLIFFRRSV